LYFRPEGRTDVRPILREGEILTKTTYDWSTDGVPDGYYRIRVDATDELDNPRGLVLALQALSEPFLLDNHPPSVEQLRFANGTLTGIARDALGPISKLEMSVDGKDFVPFYPRDDLFDTANEAFEVKLDALAKGNHVLAVRAEDARKNSSTAEIWISVK
jgi:hypothetical protein